MKHLYLIAGAVGVLFWAKGHSAQKSSTQVQDTVSSQKGSDWIGAGGLYSMWDRLSGADLTAPGYANLQPGAQADPGKVGQLSTGLVAGWDGSMVTPNSTGKPEKLA